MRFNPLHNLPLKIGAVLLAILLWVHVATNKAYEYQIEMPIQIVNVPVGLIQTNALPQTAVVRVKTSGKQLFALDARHPKLRISAAEYREGTFERELIDGDAVAAFDQVYENVAVISPRKLVLHFERQAERNLLVKSKVHLQPAAGYLIVGRPKLEPEMISVSGPASVLRSLQSLETETGELGGLTATTTQLVRLVIPDSLRLSLADSAVQITAAVEPMLERPLLGLAVRPPRGFDAGNYGFAPATISIRVGAPQSTADQVSARNVTVSFAPPDYDADSMRVPLEFKLPPDMVHLGGTVDSVLVYRKR